MPNCSAYGCRSGYDATTSQGRHFFGVPKEASLAAKWSAALARKGTTLGGKSIVCDLHFADDDLIKNYEHIVQGNLVQIPRGRWGLKPGAVPTLHLASNVEQPQKRRRKRRHLATVFESQEHIVQDERFAALRASLAECKDLCGWSVHCSGVKLVALCKMCVIDAIVVVEKAVVVHDNLLVTVNAMGRLVPVEHCLEAPCIRVNDLKDVTKLVSLLDSLNVCSGCPADDDSNDAEHSRMFGVYSEHCHVLSVQPVCAECQLLNSS